jgi:hypothetical protein
MPSLLLAITVVAGYSDTARKTNKAWCFAVLSVHANRESREFETALPERFDV